MLESVFPDQAEAIKNEREEELNRLYATREASIGRMDGKELYTIMGDLRKRVPLKKILNRIPPSEPDECFNVPPVPGIEWVPIGYAPGVMGTTPTPEAMKGSYVVVGD
jgi:hypothetical protein